MNSFWQTVTLLEIVWTLIASLGAFLCLRAYVAYVVARAEVRYWPNQYDRREMTLAAIEGSWRAVIEGWWHAFWVLIGVLNMFVPANPNIELYGVSYVLSIVFPYGLISLEVLTVGKLIMESRNRERRMRYARERVTLDAVAKAAELAGGVGEVNNSVSISEVKDA